MNFITVWKSLAISY